MTHDPLCPMFSKVWAGDTCDCDLIAKVRSDERINSLGIRVREVMPYANGYCDGENQMLAKCIAAVEALPEYALRDTTLTALRDLQEKP